MIADLRGKLTLVAEVDAAMRHELQEAFAKHGARCAEFEASAGAGPVGRVEALIVGRPPHGAVERFEDFANATPVEDASRLFRLMLQIKAASGAWPRYAIGLSTPAPDHLAHGEDLRAAGDAALETLCRYASYRLLHDDVRVNVIRYRLPPGDLAKQHIPPHRLPTLRDVANAAVALCSGMMDSVRGQVLTVDRGATFRDCLMGLFDEHQMLKP